MERRRQKRYPLRAEVRCQWTKADGSIGRVEGVTRDISTNGLFVLVDSSPSPGTNAFMEVALPPPNKTGRRAVLMTEICVIRSEAAGFAALGVSAGFQLIVSESSPCQKNGGDGQIPGMQLSPAAAGTLK